MQDTENTEVKEKIESKEIVTDSIGKIPDGGAPPAEDKPEAELTPEEINWRKVREKNKKDKEDREKALQTSQQKDDQIEALTQAITSLGDRKDAPPMTQKAQEDIISDLIDDDIPTGGEVKNFLKKFVPGLINEAITKNQKAQFERESEKEKQELPRRLRQKHSDFSEVVHKENLQYLDYHYPDISNALGALPEGEKKWSSIYNTVRKLVPNIGKSDEARMQANAQKPQSAANVSSPPSDQTGYGRSLSDSEKKENYKRLVSLARNA